MNKRNGATVVELLVVVSILGMLAALSLASVQYVRAAASRTQCSNNLRQIALATASWDPNHTRLPPGAGPRDVGTALPVLISWQVQILPQIEQEGLWRAAMAAYRQTPQDTQDPPHTGVSTVIKPYVCPADGRLFSPIVDSVGYRAAYGSYVGVGGGAKNDGVFRVKTGIRFDEITDGLSNTLLVGERPPFGRQFSGNWYAIAIPTNTVYKSACYGPYIQTIYTHDEGDCAGPFAFGPGRVINPCDSFHFWSLHGGGANFAFCDGSVRFLSYQAKAVMAALASRAGGEVVAIP